MPAKPVAALLEALWADADVRVIEAQVDPANTASVGVLVRTGFTRIAAGAEYDDYRVRRPGS